MRNNTIQVFLLAAFAYCGSVNDDKGSAKLQDGEWIIMFDDSIEVKEYSSLFMPEFTLTKSDSLLLTIQDSVGQFRKGHMDGDATVMYAKVMRNMNDTVVIVNSINIVNATVDSTHPSPVSVHPPRWPDILMVIDGGSDGALRARIEDLRSPGTSFPATLTRR
jgi:hypothetical protein